MRQHTEYIAVDDDRILVTVPEDTNQAKRLFERNVMFNVAVSRVADAIDISSMYSVIGLLHEHGGQQWEFSREELGLR